MKPKFALGLALAAATQILPVAAHAQEGAFELELNALRPAEAGCRLTYVARNGTGADLASTAFEVAVFDKEGAVSKLLILEFGALPEGKTKVVQFDVADQDCTDISRLLVNNVAECQPAGGGTPDCMAALRASSRTDVEFGL